MNNSKTLPIYLILILVIASCSSAPKQDSNNFIKTFSENSCKCIDSIDVSTKSQEELALSVNKCIDNEVAAYQMISQLMGTIKIDINSKKIVEQKGTSIFINTNSKSEQYKKYYFEIERDLMENCNALKSKMATNDKPSENSISNNDKARELYSLGIDENKKENYKKALEYFEEAVKIDPKFAFAWDNIGVDYRKLGDYDKAINAYEKSLEIDPYGLMPLQNIAVAYHYKKEYKKAISAYERFAGVDISNPEVYYGLGQVYLELEENEKSLTNLCKAYNIYTEQKSPYRSDAEKMINLIFNLMKKQGNESKFNEILKENNISPK